RQVRILEPPGQLGSGRLALGRIGFFLDGRGEPTKMRRHGRVAGGDVLMFQRVPCVLAVLLLIGLPSPEPAQQPKEGPKETRVDQYGDPLPAGAVARLGTGRLYHPYVSYLAFSPDGTKLVTVAGPGTLRVWDVDTGKEIRQWAVTPFKAHALGWSRDGRFLADACSDGFLRVWEADTAREVLKQAQDFSPAVTFSPNGKALATLAG